MGRRHHILGNVDDIARQLEQIWKKILHETIRMLRYVVWPFAFRLEKLGGEVEIIVRSYNYIGKHMRKAIGGAEREFERSAHVRVVSSFQTWTACDEHESLFERPASGYSLHLRLTQQKWNRCWTVL
ncbi:hypothetical protein TNCV_3795921 [Trichonephila clavipes]|nr:hypothetical protein TNCV_3795921 [Trichonephila clavipes]